MVFLSIFKVKFSAWNQTPTGTGQEEVMINFGHFHGYNAEFRYLFTRTGNLLDARCEGLGFSVGGIASVDVSSLNISDNEWINISRCLYINGTIELYINGVNVSNDSFVLSGNSIGLTNGDKFIGNNASDRYLIGNMDNLFLWGKTLSQQEILDYMSCPPNSDEQDLVSYWSFEDGSGSVVLIKHLMVIMDL